VARFKKFNSMGASLVKLKLGFVHITMRS
ncbi:hypothetical protein L195_g046830, partial [Trifolium pratense]